MSIKGFEVGGVQAKYDYESLDNIPANLVQDANYVHTDNNFTNADKTKLSGIEAQANKTTIDATLTQSGQAADAKATGDAISALDAQVIASMPHDTASGSIASFPDGAAMPVRDLSVAIEPVQAGSGDPSPDNVRPISGWTEAKVTRTGKNILPKLVAGIYTANGITATVDSNGLVTFSGTAGSSSANLIIPLESQFVYTKKMADNGVYFKLRNSVATSTVSSNFESSGGVSLVDIALTPANRIYNFASQASVGKTADRVRFWISSSFSYNGTYQPSIEWDNVAGSYEPYQGQTYTIDLNGTRYGGTLDVTSGKLTVTKICVDGGSFTWSKVTGNSYRNFVTSSFPSGQRPKYVTARSTVISSVYVGKNNENAPASGDNYVWIRSGPELAVKDTSKAALTPAEFKTAMTGVQFCYELETPIEVDLTPTEITTLLGTNNIFADCGDTTVDYYADTTLFVNKKIAAAVAALS